MRILCLHGNRQTAEIFEGRLARLRKRLGRLDVQLIFASAPHALPLCAGDDVPLRVWFRRNSHDADIAASTRELQALWSKHGGFDGVLGFSAGGLLGAVIAAQRESFPGLSFLVCAGAPDEPALIGDGIPASVRSLHIFGRADSLVPPESSQTLAARFTEAELMQHTKGHCFPADAASLDRIVTFLERAPRPVDSARPPPPPLPLCATEEAAEEQALELEALAAIFCSGELSVERTVGGVRGPTARFSVALDSAGLPEPLQGGKLRLQFQCGSKYPCEPGDGVDYELEIVGVLSDTLNAFEWSIEGQRAMLRMLRSRSKELAVSGAGPAAFELVSAALEWLEDGEELREASALTRTGGKPGSAEGNPGAEGAGTDEEAQLDEETCVRLATEEACEVSAALLVSSRCSGRRSFDEHGRDESQHAMAEMGGEDGGGAGGSSVAVSSKGGLWRYKVGLIGKPSAGKSTFFNCVTRQPRSVSVEASACLGRAPPVAEVAAHPFTTIEPNVGQGWWAAPSEEEGPSPLGAPAPPASFGRPPADHCSVSSIWRAFLGDDGEVVEADPMERHRKRLLPITIKDVAGLVPGAFQGRGKGNMFLNDLVDCDVLLHVLDVSGRSDRDGNELFRGEQGGGAPDDVSWIRDEPVLSYYPPPTSQQDNAPPLDLRECRGKVGLRPPPSSRRALRQTRASAFLREAQSWSLPLDLHRLVAHFLSHRFPIACCLNKVDKLPRERKAGAGDSADDAGNASEDTAIAKLRAAREAVERTGGVSVPSCAAAEAMLLRESEAGTVDYTGGAAHFRVLQSDSFALASTRQPAAGGVGGDGRRRVGGGSSGGDRKRRSVELARARALFDRYGVGTGVLQAISSAVLLRPPLLIYPVSDLNTCAPVGWGAKGDHASAAEAPPRLRDCVQLRPGSTVEAAFEALKHGALPHGARLSGIFVRAEGRGLSSSSRRYQLGRDAVLGEHVCVLRILTNRKVVWGSNAASVR